MLKNSFAYGGIFLFCIIILLGDYLIIKRYYNWGFETSQLIIYSAFLVFAEVTTFLSILKYRQLLNPYSLYSIFIYIFSLSFLKISDKQENFTFTFITVCVLSIFSFLCGCLFGSVSKTISISNVFGKLNYRFSVIISVIVLSISSFVFIAEIKQLGYLPILNFGNFDVYSDLNSNNVTPLHNFIVLCAILPTIFFIHYKRGAINGWILTLVICYCCFILLNYLSRQIIILSLLSFIIAINFYSRISISRTLLYLALFAGFFVALGSLRSSSTNEKSANEFLKIYGDIHKPTNIAETYLSLYGAVNFSVGNDIIERARKNDYLTFGKYFFRPLIASLPLDKNTVYPLKYSSYDLLGTYITDPFLDFSWLGSIMVNFFYGFFSVNSFKKYTNKISDYYILEWALVSFCIFMAAFTSYVNTFFIFFLFIISRITLK